MSVVTTYICDVSGVQGRREEFVEVYIKATAFDTNAYQYGSDVLRGCRCERVGNY